MQIVSLIKFFVGVGVFIVSGNHFSIAAVPEYIHVCHRNEKNLVACINNSVTLLKPRLESGIPELDLPPLEPFLLEEIKLRRGPSGAAINANITNLKVWGPASFIITQLRPDIKNNRFHFNVWLPHLHFEGNYEIDMQILVINIRGKGPIEGNFTDYRCQMIMQGRIITKESIEYLKFDKIRLRLDIGKAKIKLHNLFENNSILGHISDDLLSENSDVFINEIKPALENSLAEKFGIVADRITLTVPYHELFP